MVWYYPDPVHEAGRIKGLVSFYNEFVDRILVDGVEQPKPMTASSHGYYGSLRQREARDDRQNPGQASRSFPDHPVAAQRDGFCRRPAASRRGGAGLTRAARRPP